jgi:hypothetical protein
MGDPCAMADKQPRTLKDFGKLAKAEKKVLDELDTGEVIELGDGEVAPGNAGDDRRLRARFPRWLLSLLAVAGPPGLIMSN